MAFALKKFLFFWDLKVFGIVMAYFGMATSVMSAILSTIFVALSLVQEKSEHDERAIPFAFIVAVFIVFEIAFLISMFGYFFYSFQLFLGVRKVSFS